MLCIFVGLVIKNKNYIKGHGINKLKNNFKTTKQKQFDMLNDLPQQIIRNILNSLVIRIRKRQGSLVQLLVNFGNYVLDSRNRQ